MSVCRFRRAKESKPRSAARLSVESGDPDEKVTNKDPVCETPDDFFLQIQRRVAGTESVMGEDGSKKRGVFATTTITFTTNAALPSFLAAAT